MEALNSAATSVESGKRTMSMISNAVSQLQDLMRTNLGPQGTLKMLVSGSGDIKLTKDGGTLLKEMQIVHPITSVIAHTVSVQDRSMGDGTTSLILLICNLLIEAEKFIKDGVHSTHIIDGLNVGFKYAAGIIDQMKIPVKFDRPTLINVAKCSIKTKIYGDIANSLAENVVDAIHCIFDRQSMKLDLFMVEIMHMVHKTANETTLVKGIVMDHGGRHPFMPQVVKNAYVLTCNVSLEYEKTEVNATIMYSNPEDREKMAADERDFINKRCRQIVALKELVCKNGEGFVVFNQSGIDPHSLEILAKSGILALRRVKRRNMERLTLCCGGVAVSGTDNLKASLLGRAGHIKQMHVGEETYTIVDECENPRSVTMLIKGPNMYTIDQVKDAINDGLNAVSTALVTQFVLPGAAAVELEAARKLRTFVTKELGASKAQLGVEVLARALESIPKALAQNSGFDSQKLLLENSSRDTVAKPENMLGFNTETGELFEPVARGIYDSYSVKMHSLQASLAITTNFLDVDAVIKSTPQGMERQQ